MRVSALVRNLRRTSNSHSRVAKKLSRHWRCRTRRRLNPSRAEPQPPCSAGRRPRACDSRPLVRVVDHVARPALPDGHVHGVDDELRLEVVPHGPADDASRVRVEHDDQVQEAPPGRHVGDVVRRADDPPDRPLTRLTPELFGRVRRDVAADQIAGRAHPRIAERRAWSLASADAQQSLELHEPLDPLAANPGPFVCELGVDPRGTIGLPPGVVDLRDPIRQDRIGPGAGRGRA